MKPVRILLVEDNPDHAELAEDALSQDNNVGEVVGWCGWSRDMIV